MKRYNYPLRKIVERDVAHKTVSEVGLQYIIWFNRLECGHLMRVPRDFYGERHNEYKQRCRECYIKNLKNESNQ